MATALIVETELGIPTEVVQFDVTLSESHESVSVITDFPVESGADVSDHIRTLPKALAVEVFVTNTPTRPQVLRVAQAAALAAVWRGRYGLLPLDIPTPFV